MKAPAGGAQGHRSGAWVALRVPSGLEEELAALPVTRLADGLDLESEFSGGRPENAVAYLRRIEARRGDIEDDGLLLADAVVHVASVSASTVERFCTELSRLLPERVTARVLAGARLTPSFTGQAMHEFAYANQATQLPAAEMPNAFIVPLSKSAEWWKKGWMERHTYFLPRYDDEGGMISEGHVLASAPGIPALLRRTYKNRSQPAPRDQYDFVNHFECSDADVPVYETVCERLRDVARNPEWAFVKEGPTWRGCRVETWIDLFAGPGLAEPARPATART